jgi:glyoxylase I family protein
MLLGSINHVSITVSDLAKAMEFFRPFLEFLGYHTGEVIQDRNGQHLTVNVNFANGSAINVWQAKPELAAHPFQVYEVGLHHLAFNTETHEQVNRTYELVKKLGGRNIGWSSRVSVWRPGRMVRRLFSGSGSDEIRSCPHAGRREEIQGNAAAIVVILRRAKLKKLG